VQKELLPVLLLPFEEIFMFVIKKQHSAHKGNAVLSYFRWI